MTQDQCQLAAALVQNVAFRDLIAAIVAEENDINAQALRVAVSNKNFNDASMAEGLMRGFEEWWPSLERAAKQYKVST